MAFASHTMTATTTPTTTFTTTTTLSASSFDEGAPASRGFLFRGPSFSRYGARDANTAECSSSSSLTLGRATPTTDDSVASCRRSKASSSRTTVDQSDSASTMAASGKDALCRRMGALFLRHKVEKLEDDVEKMQQQQQHHRGGSQCPVQRRLRNAQLPNSSSTSVTSATTESSTTLPSLTNDEMESRSRSSGENSCERRKSPGKEHCLPSRLCASRTWCKSKSMPAAPTSASATTKDSVASLERRLVAGYDATAAARAVTRVIVADVSLLIYSLRTVHQWLKAGDCHVVVPREALSTLDVLKKGEHFLNLAARRATRFLDERFAAVTNAIDAAPQSDNNAVPAPFKAGLYPQGMKQRLDLTDADGEVALAQAGITVAALSQAPLPVAKTLACALHFVRQYGDRPDVSCSLAIALPPPHIDFDSADELDNVGGGGGGVVGGGGGGVVGGGGGGVVGGAANAADLRYAERADGNHILHWSKACGLSDEGRQGGQSRLVVAPTAASWLAAGPRGPPTGTEEHQKRHGHDHSAVHQHGQHHDHHRRSHHAAHHHHHPRH